jgi:hypothetical protein
MPVACQVAPHFFAPIYASSKMMNALPLALASDFNPFYPSGNMNFTAACVKQK